MTDLMVYALARIPVGHYVKFEIETGEDGPFLSATVFERAPEDGWPSRSARFGAKNDPDQSAPCPEQFSNDDALRWGVTAPIDRPDLLETLLVNAIDREWPRQP